MFDLLRVRRLSAVLTAAVYVFSAAASSETLPNPLTLNAALSFANSDHPELLLANANLAFAVSRRLEVESTNDLDAYFEIAPATSNPTTNNRFLNDGYVRLSVTKTLYDFGYSDSLEVSADEAVISQELIVEHARSKNHIKVMQLYFDVLLADMHFAALDEEMTSLYVQYDKLLERQSLGMVSDVAVAEAENIYREAADRRKASEINRQSSRLRLAIALNRPDDIPGELIRPDLPQLEQPVPELDVLLEIALKNNRMITALEHDVRAGKASVKAAQQQYGPTLAAGLEMNEYERNLPGRNNASIGVTFRVPLTGGSKSQAEMARAAAGLQTSQAKYDLARYALRQQLSDLVNRLEILQYKRNTDDMRLNNNALSLEKSRARYELELQTTLGDSMAKYTEAEWLSAKNDFEIATTWAQLELLTGKKLYQDKEN